MDIGIENIKKITSRISLKLLNTEFKIRIERDNKRPIDGRIFIQIVFDAPCTKNGEMTEWHGRKWYLSDAMTEDEVVKTVYSAFKSAVEHEVMEGFKVDGIILFNSHLNFEELLDISHKEIRRSEPKHFATKLNTYSHEAIKINALELRTRAFNCLLSYYKKDNNEQAFKALCSLETSKHFLADINLKELNKMKNVGKSTFYEVVDFIKNKGVNIPIPEYQVVDEKY